MPLIAWIMAVILYGFSSAAASTVRASELDDKGIGAGLYVQRDDMAVENAAADFDVRADRFGFLLSELVHPQLNLGLLGGIVAVDTRGQPMTEGMQLAGEYIGVYLTGTAFEGQRWSIAYDASLFYQSADDKRDDQRVEFDWLEGAAAVKAVLNVSNMVSLYAGPYYRSVDIDQRASGAINETSTFHEQDALDAMLGAILETDPGGYIDLAIHRGASDGFVLTFRRQY